jgi:hypothetical protein
MIATLLILFVILATRIQPAAEFPTGSRRPQLTPADKKEFERRAMIHGFIDKRTGRRTHYLCVSGWPGPSPTFIRDGKICKF